MQFVKPITAKKRAFSHESGSFAVTNALTEHTCKRVRSCKDKEMEIAAFYEELKQVNPHASILSIVSSYFSDI